MVLSNQTSWQAILQVANLGVDPLAAVVIGKATYDLAPDGTLTPAAEPMPILPDPLAMPFGELHGEFFFRKQGADVCVLGTVRRKSPVKRASVQLQVGALRHELNVSGDRVWRATGERQRPLAPSAPLPFTEMPLSYARAFGGAADYEGHAAAWPDNPGGLGYYLTVEQAREKPLPNIEAASAPPVERWDDRPRVAGWAPYPMHWGLRASTAVQVDPKTMSVKHVSPAIFNHAHPDLVVAEVAPGQPVRIDGLWDTPLEVKLPRKRMHVEVTANNQTFVAASRIDGVFIWTDAFKVVITQRANFGYAFAAGDLRRAVVTEVEA
jgi:hypothetical protein